MRERNARAEGLSPPQPVRESSYLASQIRHPVPVVRLRAVCGLAQDDSVRERVEESLDQGASEARVGGFSRLILIHDNVKTHSSKETQARLTAIPKLELRFQPVCHQWVNRIECLWKAMHDTITRDPGSGRWTS